MLGGLELRESHIDTEQMNPAALVYFVHRQFRRARVS